MEKYFLTQIKYTNENWEKGVVVKDTLDGARQSFHAYLGAYGYGKDVNTTYVAVYINGIDGVLYDRCIDDRIPVPEPEPEPTPDPEPVEA